MRALLALILTLAAPISLSNAQEFRDIPVEEWRALALGRTLTYTIDGNFFAFERYAPDGNQLEIQSVTGECMSGTWAFEDGAYCFYWDQSPKVCFRHFRAGGQIIISSIVDGVEIGSYQTMSTVSDAQLNCGMNLS